MPQKPPKHPNRQKEHPKVRDLEAGLFEHLKKGKLYRYSFVREMGWNGSDALQKKPLVGSEYRINTMETGKVVMYLGTESSGHGTFHKIVYGDQVGYVRHSGSARFKRVTKRHLEREEKRLLHGTDEGNTV